MARRKSLFSIRKPRIRISKKGKIGFSPGSMRVGNRRAGLNLSKSGVSASFGAGPVRYNTRRGTSLRCLPMLVLMALGAGASMAVILHAWL